MFGTRGVLLCVVVSVVVVCAMSVPAQATDTFFTVTLAAYRGGSYGSGTIVDSTGSVLQTLPSPADYVSGVAAEGSDLYISQWGSVARYNSLSNGWDTVISAGALGGGGLGPIYVDGGNIYVAVPSQGRIAECTTAGALVNPNFVTGLAYPQNMTVNGGLLYVSDYTNGTVGVYDATTGIAVNSSLINTGGHAMGVAVTDDAIYTVTYRGGPWGYIGKYNLDGTDINSQLVYGLSSAYDIRVSGNNLYVVGGYDHWGYLDQFSTDGTYGVQLASLGGEVNALALVQPVPEPVTMISTFLALGGLGGYIRRRMAKK